MVYGFLGILKASWRLVVLVVTRAVYYRFLDLYRIRLTL